MRQISIKQLKANLCKEMQSLPFEVTKYGKIVATMYKGGHKIPDKVVTTPDIKNGSNEGGHNSIKQ